MIKYRQIRDLRHVKKAAAGQNAVQKGVMTINEKQKKFCTEYIKDFDAERAALDAGYIRASDGWRLLKRADVRTELLSSISSHDGRIATHEEVLMFLTDVMRRDTYDEVTVQSKEKLTRTDENGNKINEERTVLSSVPQRVKLSDAMSAADKLHKYYMQKTEADDEGETGIVILPEIRQ